ncbi:MAG: division/cell wall cluster transcriptional repressor MraZ [Dictyoglomus sp. NZ13-RE01]|nr:MAG: division/cell wall cluster transcriptional repressor MraZ [Dictyoglomus sp. NZ13-RE01]
MFIGEYIHSLDEKGRLTIPNVFRQELGDKFYITRGFNKCLHLYTIEEWMKFSEFLLSFSPTDEASINLKRFWFSSSVEGCWDKLGRVLIPVYLREYAELDKDVVIIGVGKYIEVWNKENWEKFKKQVDLLEKLKEINEKVERSWK